MNLWQNILSAFTTVRSNILRSALTVLVIAVGIASLVGILTAIDTAIYALSDNLSNIGANSITIVPKGQGIQAGGGHRRKPIGDPISFSQAQLFKEKFKFPASIGIHAIGLQATTVSHQENQTSGNIQVLGVDQDFLTVKGITLIDGRNFSPLEINSGRNTVIVGSEIVDLLFDSDPSAALGAKVQINSNKFTIIGIMEQRGEGMGQSNDQIVLCPVTLSNKLFLTSKTNYTIDVAVSDPQDLLAVEMESIGTMRNVRKLGVGIDNDFEIIKSDGLLNILEDSTAELRLGAFFIALITLSGAAIGLMNIMLVSVTERTKEIGICKAIGATSRNILIQFLTEALVICQLGGLFGVLFGIIIGVLVSIVMEGTFYMPWLWILVAFSTCLVVGLMAGIYPALRASKLDPIESLRYE